MERIDLQRIWADPMRLVSRIFLYLVVLAGAISFLLPFAWTVRTSIMPPWQVYAIPPEWIPKEYHFENYLKPFQWYPFLDYFKNSFLIAGLNIAGTIMSSSLVAYAFARLRFPEKRWLFLVVLSTMMLPYHTTLIPQYLIFSRLGWVNTFLPLVVPQFLGVPYYIFLLRQFFMTISPELDDAAKIDGCSLMGIFFRILLPLSRPALGIVAIQTFTSAWNSFMSPLVYLHDADKYTVALSLRLFSTRTVIEMEPLMAATTMAVLPLIILFFFAQRYFVQGIVITGIKG